MGKVLQFNINNNDCIITFEEFIAQDNYLRITALNALDKLGYDSSPEGVMQFQQDVNCPDKVEVNGIIDYPTFVTLTFNAFTHDTNQEILNHIMRTSDFETSIELDNRWKNNLNQLITKIVCIIACTSTITYFVIYTIVKVIMNNAAGY